MALSRLLPASFEQPNPVNFIINGNMTVAQRATSATASGNGTYNTIDRWKTWDGNDGAFTSEQSTDSPEGFSNSLKLACTTADTSLAAGTYAAFAQIIEAQNLQSLDYGSSDAKPITLSFWVKSNKTGTYCNAIEKPDSTLYRYVKEYTINSANTWEYKTVTILPDSNIKGGSGAIANDNGQGFRVFWSLGHGSTYTGATDNTWHTGSQFATNNQVNWMDSTSNTFYITGVCLNVGSKSISGNDGKSFPHESFAETLAKCHRYYQVINDEFAGQTNAYANFACSRWGTNQAFVTVPLVTPLRGKATTISIPSGTGMGIRLNGGIDESASPVHLNTEKNGKVSFYFGSLSFDPTNGYGGIAFMYDNSIMTFDAEL
jgi:hypothetical protein